MLLMAVLLQERLTMDDVAWRLKKPQIGFCCIKGRVYDDRKKATENDIKQQNFQGIGREDGKKRLGKFNVVDYISHSIITFNLPNNFHLFCEFGRNSFKINIINAHYHIGGEDFV